MKKILVIDDDENSLESLSSYFIESGFTVLTAKNALNGLEIIRNCLPDLIISDIRMPGLNGIELAYILKGFKYGISIILISAYYVEDKENLKNISFGFLEKPIDIKKLNQFIKKALK